MKEKLLKYYTEFFRNRELELFLNCSLIIVKHNLLTGFSTVH
jgi:hypothetical protein